MMVKNSVYESAVKGRRDFRAAYRVEREKFKALWEVLNQIQSSIDNRLRSGGSLSREWAMECRKKINAVLDQFAG